MRLTLLHNPSAGEEDHDRSHLETILVDAGHEVTYASLKEDGWADVLAESADLIVVAGGDGSVRKVFTAIGSAPTTVALVPLGSANNVASSLGLDEARALRLLTGAEPASTRRFDVWEVASTWGRSRCVEAAGGGLFANLLERADDSAADPSGPAKVDFGLLLLERTLASLSSGSWGVEIDGVRAQEELLGVEAMNIRALGAGLALAPAAECGDMLLDVVVIRPDDRRDLQEYVSARLRDEPHTDPQLESRRGGHVVLEPPRGVPLHVDDVLPAWDDGVTSRVEIYRGDTQVDVLVGG